MAEKDPQLPLNQILIFNFYWPAQSETMPVVTESGVIMCWERRRKKESVHDEDRSAVTMLPFNGGGDVGRGGSGEPEQRLAHSAQLFDPGRQRHTGVLRQAQINNHPHSLNAALMQSCWHKPKWFMGILFSKATFESDSGPLVSLVSYWVFLPYSLSETDV